MKLAVVTLLIVSLSAFSIGVEARQSAGTKSAKPSVASANTPDCSDVEWEVRKSVDEVSGAEQCSVYTTSVLGSSNGSPMFFATKMQQIFVVMGQSYPGEAVAIQIDKAKAHRFPAKGSSLKTTRAILAELRKGKIVKTRYVAWPQRVSRDKAIPICDLPAKIAACIEAVQAQPQAGKKSAR